MAQLASIRALAFDLYGTLLDVRSVEARCAEVISDAAGLVTLWRAKQLEYAFLRTLMGRYEDFWRVTGDALDYAAERLGVTLTAAQRDRLMDAWLTLAPFPEVPAALRALADHPLAVLSNGSPRMLSAVLENSDLCDHFTHVLSVDAARAYKPLPAVYELAPQAFGLAPAEILFVSANGFDTAGARSFGYPVCWVNRTAATPDRLGQTPSITVRDLNELADQLHL
jgi:2-haloacid dehalogenase